MKQYLIETKDSPKKTAKQSVYENRMQKRVTRELNNFFWLCRNFPDKFLDEGREHKDETGKIVPHRRLKMLLLCLKVLNPKIEVELVLKNLDFPDD